MNPPAAEISLAALPPILPKPACECSALRKPVAFLLSLYLGLFLADAVVSLLDDSLNLFFGVHVLSVLRSSIFLPGFLLSILIYGLIGLLPMIPKRLFLPIILFNPAAILAVIPVEIFFHSRVHQFCWFLSLCQLLCGLGVLHLVQGGFKFPWLLFPENRLNTGGFSWWNLSSFLLVNVFVLTPVLISYLVFALSLAVERSTDGFLKLRPAGVEAQSRSYVRDDGKTIQLYPMSHIANAGFYRDISQAFPADSIILQEGVSDRKHLLKNGISYKRMATALGLSEQTKEFKPGRGKIVRADVDVDQFAPGTIDLLNRIMLIYAKGLTAENLRVLLQNPVDQDQLWDDLLRKRNQHLLEEIHSRLLQTNHIVVPWGAGHMPELAREILKSGFHLESARDYALVPFRFSRDTRPPGKAEHPTD